MSDIDLTNQLRRLACALPREAGPDVELHLMSAFRKRYQRRRVRLIYLAIAALVCIAFVVAWVRHRNPPASYENTYSAAGFIALPYADSGVPMESVVVVRVQVRPSELALMGVAMPVEASGVKLTADLLVGQDGVPRAFRLVQ